MSRIVDTRGFRAPAAFVALLALASLSPAPRASVPQTWEYPTRPTASGTPATPQTVVSETGDARLDGVAVAEDGALGLSIPLREIYPGASKMVAPPIFWSAGNDLSGNVMIGTGNSGEVIRIDAKGASASYADTDELGVRAVVSGDRGDMYMATFPAGGVYRITAAGSAEPWFEASDRYIWALAFDPMSGLYVASGDRGIIYRVTDKAEGKPFFDSTEAHITTLALEPPGNLLAGTATNGLLYRISSDGKGKVLLESGLSEISAIAVTPTGTIFAAAMGEEQIQAPRKPGEKSELMIEVTPAADGSALEESTDLPKKITIDLADLIPAAGAAVAGTAARIYKIEPGHSPELVWKSDLERVYSMVFSGERGLLFGTGGPSSEGRIYRLEDSGAATLLHELREAQVTALVAQPGGRIYACTSNPARVHLLDTGLTSTGSYTSTVVDAGHEARWGAIAWDAAIPEGTRLELKTRSGNRPTPDESWSDWSPPYSVEKGSAISGTGARYLQWKADLSRLKTDATPSLRHVKISLLPQNRPPAVTGLTVLATATPVAETRASKNAGVSAESPPSSAPGGDKSPGAKSTPAMIDPPKGSRWVTWNTSDPDGDRVTGTLRLRQRTAGASEFTVLAAGLTASPYALDDSKLAEGSYEIRLDVDDSDTNGRALALKETSSKVVFLVDHTAPQLETHRATGKETGDSPALLEVVASDASGTIARGEYALDAAAGPWNPLPCKDGICDTPLEYFMLDLPDSAKSVDVTIRVTDSAGNSASINVTARDRKQGN